LLSSAAVPWRIVISRSHPPIPLPCTHPCLFFVCNTQRVPEVYTKAIFSAYLASRYVYKHGIAANEFAFFEFMQPYLKKL
jgi:hypothetical protein